MLLDLYIYPHPILAKKAEPVTDFNDELATLVENMYETMVEGSGVGLAAPQVGISKRIFIVDISKPGEPSDLRAYINPKIILKDSPIVWNEGCLSLPALYRDVKTFEHVIIEAQDVQGNTFREEAHDLRAVALLHEYDHLEGNVFIDRLSPIKKRMIHKFWARHFKRETEKTYQETRLKYVYAED